MSVQEFSRLKTQAFVFCVFREDKVGREEEEEGEEGEEACVVGVATTTAA